MSPLFKGNFFNKDFRINILMAVIFLLVMAIVWRIFSLQVLDHSNYYAIAQDQYQVFKKLAPQRGKIYVSDFASSRTYPVATNEERYLVYAVPDEIGKDADVVSGTLANIIGMQKSDILKKIGKENDRYEPVKHGVSREVKDKITDLKINGLRTSPEDYRYYPDGVFASHILGFVGYGSDSKRSGRYGIESYFNKELEGKSGYIDSERDGRGNLIPIILDDSKPSENGKDIVLTIDQTIQYVAEKKLKAAVEQLKAEGGTIIVMDPHKGSVLAMASYPNFDPNEYGKVESYETFINPAVQRRYEPGSVIKPFTMAAALDAGKVSPNTTYEDKGFLKVDDRTIHNFDDQGRGIATMTQVLEQSLNTGAVFAQTQVGKSAFLAYFKDYGFDLPTGIELDGEVGGDLSNLERGSSNIAYATASFGQGIALTPLEVITATSAMANDGKLMKPFIVDKTIDASGKETTTSPTFVRQVVSPRTAAQLSAMMVSVYKSSFYKQAVVPGYNLAIKSGTAQVPNPDKKGYSDQTIHTLIGYGPVPSPQFSILIKVDKPQGAHYASTSLTPTFRELSKFLLEYYHIEPNSN